MSERARERETDKGRERQSEQERGREGWGLECVTNEPINPGCLLPSVKSISIADA